MGPSVFGPLQLLQLAVIFFRWTVWAAYSASADLSGGNTIFLIGLLTTPPHLKYVAIYCLVIGR